MRVGRSKVLFGSLLVVVVLIAVGATAWGLSSGSNSQYRLAVATTGDVEQTLDSVGTLEPSTTSTLKFQVGGTVASVSATVGQQVSAGQTLAGLDTSAYSATVTTDQSVLDQAEQALTADEATEASESTSTTTASTTTTVPSGSGDGSSGSQSVTALAKQLASDQQQADKDQATASSDAKTASTDCAGSGEGSAACVSAEQAALTGDQQLATDLTTVANDESKLADLENQAEAASSAGPTSGTSTSRSSGSGGAGTTGGGSASGSTEVNPQRIAADQAAIDADTAQLSQAQQTLAEATLTTPIAGTVVSVDMSAGQVVSAGSSSATVVVEGTGAFEAITDVSVTDLPLVKVGQSALVTPDGATQALAGTVSSIGASPTSSSSTGTSGASGSSATSSSTSTDYQVVVSVPESASGLFDGAAADVSIVVGQASHVTTVPTSAIHRLGTFDVVTELRDAKVTPVPVTVGVAGEVLTQITKGVSPGDQVVLADLSTPIPSSNTATTPGRGLGGAGAFGGGGGTRVFGGGAGGGAATFRSG